MPALLDRKPSPPDARDYKLSDFLKTPPAPDPYADKTIREIAAEGVHFPFIWQLWALIKRLEHPTPPPIPPQPILGTKVWPDAEQLDQGETGHCVGFGTFQWGNALPFDDHFTSPEAHEAYYAVKSIELGRNVPNYQPPGSGPADVEDGAYVRDGMKHLQSMGRLTTYARAANTTEITLWVLQHGPVVVGSEWLAGMDNYDQNTGLMHATGGSRGGHCWMINGFVQAEDSTPWGSTFPVDVYTMQNSWGNWAMNGFAAIPVTDFAHLLAQQGEAWAAAELPF